MELKQTITTNFIKHKVDEDLKNNKNLKLITRFPPEPNGYLHVGHAKSICLNFGMAQNYPEALCNLRFDDTNPSKEKTEYVEAIKNDIKWLGFKWDGEVKYASDYFQYLYESAIKLINLGLAYVCELSPDEIREQRGTLTKVGQNSPFRNRTIEENLKLFHSMKEGLFNKSSCTLRAKIDMSSGNINMRDPIIYRMLDAEHHRTKDAWCIYPMYDFAHSLSDAYEGITHSFCTLEFQDHRPLYDWFVDNVNTQVKPQQIEFSRLELNYTITSKRKLRELVEENNVEGWDDPRLPTIIGMRRRGYPPRALRNFCEMIGISKKETVIDVSLLEECVRDELNKTAPRRMTVLDPLKITLTNYPKDKTEEISAPNHPQKEEMGYRNLPFGKEIYIEREDFMENPPGKYFRLAPGKEVRLRYAYIIKCEEIIKDPKTGEITELLCTYDNKTLGKQPEGRKVKGIIHWLAKEGAKPATVRLYDRLFNVENPNQKDKDYREFLNPNSLEVLTNAYVEKDFSITEKEQTFQFERLGYFNLDKASNSDSLIFNRTVSLKDTWQK